MLADGLCVGEIFHADGFIVLHDVFSAEHISSLHLQAVQSFAEVSSIIKERNFQFGVGVKQGFKEIVQRHPNRYEMPYRMSEDVYNFVLGNPLIRETVSKILQCDDYIVANRSLVISMPGCDDQAWHSDGPHMSATQDLPCHCLNVFIPLVDVNSENGPTEIRPGSHFYTRDLAKSMFLAKIKKTLRPIEGPHLTKGSVLMFDYRVLHRGTTNKSAEMRPILVFTFAKPWYKDTLNFPHRSVFDAEDTPVMPDELQPSKRTH